MTRIPITQKMLVDWGGAQTLKDAEALVEKGAVQEAEYDPPHIRGTILWNNRPLKTSLTIMPDGTVDNHCPCWANKERGVICAHVIALGVLLVRRATDPMREAKYQEELRRASRLAAVDESAYVQRVPPETPGAMPAKLKITLAAGWMEGCAGDSIPVVCEVEYHGKTMFVDKVPRDIPLTFSKQDESLLFVLDDISEGPARGHVSLNRTDFANLISLHAGRALQWEGHPPIKVNEAKMTTFLRMDLDRENGELILMAHTELPFMKAGQYPFYIIAGRSGWVYGAENLWPLENIMPDPYRQIYGEPVIIARPDVLRFLQHEIPLLEKYTRIESDISGDLFTIEPATPKFRLLVQGSPASLAARLYARYDGIELVACKQDARGLFGIPDPDDLMRYTVRNLEAEKRALDRLGQAGLAGDCGDNLSHIVGNREVLNFLGGGLPALRRHGWQIEFEGRVGPYMESVNFATPVVSISGAAGTGWFDVGFRFEDGEGHSLSSAEIQTALRKGECFIKKGERTILIDSEAVDSMQDIFSDCASGESDKAGHFRMADSFSAFVKSALDALDGVDVEDTPEWRTRAEQFNRTATIEAVQLPEPLNGTLRLYQKDGVNWLRFLEKQGFCGLLADEMGLGKTVQALAWLNLGRCDEESRGRPALIVCPTSIVENWAEEAARFVPGMKVTVLSGPERHEKWDQLKTADIAITSYALLRRDLERYLGCEFSTMILDEAQHIKNRSTQNALAAKQVKARHRLVLTGTPIENSVSDLWSIMDFLMPGYLGSHDVFKQNYETPVSRAGQEGEAAQARLKRKMHPFLLRRLKSDVARDLPAKIERVSFCQLSGDQRAVYNELLAASQRQISNMVSQRGFNKCRMEILTCLMRLRQVCCHLDLLKLPDLKAEYPSSKTELFFELLDEAFDSGHRILVFSQFVSMLTILRKELETRNLAYCYLDGATKDRMEVVRRFNTERSIPLFLISLKAGGSGLNLTGADMVVHFDPWWNPAVEDQATDRAHRIGQKRTVYSVKLITRNTVEEKVLALQKRKKDVIDATIESDEGMIQAMSWEDVQELLSL